MTQQPIPIESMAEGMRAPEAMRNAIRRALAKSPDERFQTVKDFVDAFAGAAPAARPGGTSQVAAAGPPPRAKTEVGAPLDVAAAFGGGPPAASGGPSAPMAQGYTPVGGNVAFPTPAGIPQPPPRDQGGSKSRTMLLATAGLVAVASVVAIVFAVKGSSGGKAVQFENSIPSAPPQTVLTGQPATSDTGTPAPADSGGGALPPLNGGSGGGGGSGGHTQPPHTNPNPPNPNPPNPNPPNPNPPNPNPNPPNPNPKPKYDGPECQTARRLKALGHAKEAESWALACIAKGGNPN